MFTDLHAIEKACANPALITNLAIVDPKDLQRQPNWLQKPNISSLAFKSGKAAYFFGVDRFSGRLTDSTEIGNRAGDFVNYLLFGSIKGLRLDVEWLRAKLLNRRVHVIATYATGENRFIPFIRLVASGDSGDKSNASKVEFRGSSRLSKIAPFFNGNFTVIGDGVGDVPPGATAVYKGEIVKDDFTTAASTATFNLPPNVLLVGVFIKSNAPQSPTIGLTAGGEELGGPQDLLANEPYTFSQSYKTSATTTIYFSGLSGANAIEVWYAQLGAGDVIVVKTAVSASSYEFAAPEGVLLAAVYVKGDTDQTVSVGLTSGGEELGGPQELLADEAFTFAQTMRTGASTTIFVSGLTGANNLEIWYYL